MITAINGYVLKCEECKVTRTDVEFDLQMTYLWANNHGTKIRIWCHRCGATHDIKLLKSATDAVIEKRNVRVAIWNDEYWKGVRERQADDEALAEEYTE